MFKIHFSHIPEEVSPYLGLEADNYHVLIVGQNIITLIWLSIHMQ